MARGTVAGSTFGTLVLGTLLLRTAILPAASPPAPAIATQKASSTSTPGTTKKSHKTSWTADDGPWKASRAHFAGFFPSTDCPAGKQRWCIPDDERIAAMIAIAPDPLHSHLALAFDRTVEAVKLGAQSANYVADRYWLPWDISPKTDWADYDSLQQATVDQREKEKQPGLLLFRWDGKQEEPQNRQDKPATVLYVFLVADTATAGINGEQFRNAVEYVNEVCEKTGGSTGRCTSFDTIHIMGPTFSGSLASLRRLVEANKPRTFVAYSGTVSSLCAQENQHLLDSPDLLAQAAWLCDRDQRFYKLVDPALWANKGTFSRLCSTKNRDASQKNDSSIEAALLCQHYHDYKPAPNLTFHSLANSTESAVNRFIESLQQDSDIKCEGTQEVAILSEAATTYGETTQEHNPGVLADGETAHCSYVTFSYPREIASLRNASQVVTKPGQPTTSNPGGASPYLPLNLADQTNRSDEPPDFSSLQGPLSKEAVLMNFAAAMRRDHYKYIGIIATNVLDALFLTTFLRKAVPNARLFLVNADLLLERDLDNAPYIGTLAVSSYPLVLRNLDWTSDWTNPKRQPSRLPFEDQYEEGEFNAALLSMKEMLPAETKSAALAYECGGQSCSSQTRPLWLTVVGTGGYWPVRMLSGLSPAGRDHELIRHDFAGAWTVVSVFLCALGLVHCGVLLRAWPFSSLFRDFSLLNAKPGQRLLFIHTASATLVLALLMAGAPAWRLRPWPAVGTAIVITIVILLLTCGLLESNYLFSPAKASQWRLLVLQILASLGVWCVAAVLALRWMTLFDNVGSGYGFFFSYRTLHLATGVSPLTPMLPLLATIYFWAIGEVWRLRFSDQTRPRLNPLGTADDAAEDGERKLKLRPGMGREGSIANSISEYLLSPPYVICFVLIFAVWFVFFDPRHAFELFERRAFGILYEILFCIVVALILSTGFRMSQVWLELKGLLLELNRSLVRFTFHQLKESGWSSLWQPGTDELEWNYMVHSMELIRQLGSGASQSTKPLKAEAATIAEILSEIRKTRERLQEKSFLLPAVCTTLEYAGRVTSPSKKMADDCRQLLLYIGQIQDYLARSLGKVLDVLQDRWAQRFPGLRDDSAQEKEVWPVIVHCSEKPNEKDSRVVTYRYDEEIDAKAEQQMLLERYAALRYVAFIRSVLGRIRFMLIFLAVSFSLLLISLNVYSFEPHQALIWSLTAIFAVTGFLCVVVLMQAHRDPVLSSITGTKPNHLDPAFYIRIVALGAVPLFTLLSTHFPAIGRALVSFVQPGLDALK